jgi:homoserine dehydrogenase
MKDVRVWVAGLGTVGQWLLRALHEHAASLQGRYRFVPTVIGVASARHGLVHDADGLDPLTVLEHVSRGRPLKELPGVRHWPNAVEGLGATDADVLIEVTASSVENGEPGVTHMREALRRGIPVVTSNKWPVALHGVELAELARKQGVPFRAESTVMSGTPVLSTLIDGLAGTTPTAVRGILNATANFILTRMEDGASYEDALRKAQDLGLAERDPTADVEGYDSMAKAMILAGLVFGRQLSTEDIVRRGIIEIDRGQIESARLDGAHVKELVTLEFQANVVLARVEPTLVSDGDPLASVTGVVNAIICRAEPVGEVMVTGRAPGLSLRGRES